MNILNMINNTVHFNWRSFSLNKTIIILSLMVRQAFQRVVKQFCKNVVPQLLLNTHKIKFHMYKRVYKRSNIWQHILLRERYSPLFRKNFFLLTRFHFYTFYISVWTFFLWSFWISPQGQIFRLCYNKAFYAEIYLICTLYLMASITRIRFDIEACFWSILNSFFI